MCKITGRSVSAPTVLIDKYAKKDTFSTTCIVAIPHRYRHDFSKNNNFFILGIDKSIISAIIFHVPCGCSSSGRAPPCQGGGSEFEPRHPLHKKKADAFASAFFLFCGDRLEKSNPTRRWRVGRAGLTARNLYSCRRQECNRASSPAFPISASPRLPCVRGAGKNL